MVTCVHSYLHGGSSSTLVGVNDIHAYTHNGGFTSDLHYTVM